MTETRYQLVFSGRLQPGTSLEQARRAIRERFGLDGAQLDRLFGGDPVTVKRGLDKAHAERYRQAFAAAGALVEARPESSAAAADPGPPSVTLGTHPDVEPAAKSPTTVADSDGPAAGTASSQARAEGGPLSRFEEPEPLQLLPAGAPIGEQPPAPAEPPDTSHLRLAPSEATSLEDCAPPPPAPPPLDLSALELTPIEPAKPQD